MKTENCPKCGTPMIAAKNKNRGYFATCPNKANHDGVPTDAEKALAKETPKPTEKSIATGKTLFGW